VFPYLFSIGYPSLEASGKLISFLGKVSHRHPLLFFPFSHRTLSFSDFPSFEVRSIGCLQAVEEAPFFSEFDMISFSPTPLGPVLRPGWRLFLLPSFFLFFPSRNRASEAFRSPSEYLPFSPIRRKRSFWEVVVGTAFFYFFLCTRQRMFYNCLVISLFLPNG